jgi:NAD(P)-dependent dehydrogenase (short-subunit alcohol dehydrogenase family)
LANLLVTGATSGIGLEFVRKNSPKYDKVFCYGRNFEELKSYQVENCVLLAVDFSRTFQDYDCSSLEELDAVVFAAGAVKNNVLKFHDCQNLIETINVNLVSQLNLLGALVRNRKVRARCSIVFISSLLGPHIGMLGGLAYAASKSGIEGAVKVAALELARIGARVNSVSPGMVETPLTDSLPLGENLLDADRAKYPLGQRYASVEDVVNMIEFLVSDRSAFVTGENIKVDGGYTIR